VLHYDSLPSAFIVEIDDTAWLGLHLNTGTALRNPHFEIELERGGEATLLGKMVRDELDKVLSMATRIQIDSVAVNPDAGKPQNKRKS
jgi:hypothetical protein